MTATFNQRGNPLDNGQLRERKATTILGFHMNQVVNVGISAEMMKPMMVATVMPFEFDGKNVRLVMIDGKPHGVGKDLCDVLRYSNHNKAMGDHCRGVTIRYPIADALGRMQETRMLSEGDMMRLICASTLPAAQRFERLVFEEILPCIHRHGCYPAPTQVRLPTAKELAQLVIAESDRADRAEDRANDQERRADRAEARVDLLSGKVDELLPAVHALDELVATPGSECGTDAAKTLGVSPKWLFLYMQAIEWIYKRGVRSGSHATSIPWTMTDEAWKLGYVERNIGHREARKPNGEIVILPTNTVYVTREGLKELAKHIAVLRADGKELPTTLELIQLHLERVKAEREKRKAAPAARNAKNKRDDKR